MESWLLEHEGPLRLFAFFGMFGLLALAEWRFPRRQRLFTRLRRWSANLSLVVFNTLLLRLLFPLAAVGMAVSVQSAGWGWLNQTHWPSLLELALALVILDFVIWLQHVMVHALPLLWRLHRVHHADPDYDLTTGSRFHPLEILLSMGIKFAAITLLGAPPAAVLLFELILSSSALFNHANLRLPLALDGLLRWLVVTPDMHRVHHSILDNETNSNFGFFLPWWDRLFGTYQDQPEQGHQGMTIGTLDCPNQMQATSLPGLLLIPFQGRIAGYTINRRSWSSDTDQSVDAVTPAPAEVNHRPG